MASVAQQTAGAAAGATPWGAVAQGASSIVNNVVDNLFMSGQQKKAQEFKNALAVLDNQQQANLNYQMLNAKTDTDRMQILTNAVTSIKQTQLTGTAASQNKNMIMILVAVVVLVMTVYLLNR